MFFCDYKPIKVSQLPVDKINDKTKNVKTIKKNFEVTSGQCQLKRYLNFSKQSPAKFYKVKNVQNLIFYNKKNFRLFRKFCQFFINYCLVWFYGRFFKNFVFIKCQKKRKNICNVIFYKFKLQQSLKTFVLVLAKALFYSK